MQTQDFIIYTKLSKSERRNRDIESAGSLAAFVKRRAVKLV